MLVVSNETPSERATGLRRRLYHTLNALAQIARVDLFSVVDPEWATPAPAAEDLRLLRTRVIQLPRSRRRRRVLRTIPGELAAARDEAVRQAFLTWAAPPYDLVWFSRVNGYVMLADLLSAPHVVDLDDLEHRKLMAQRRARATGPERPRLAETLRWLMLERRVARTADAVVLCSTLDRDRLGMGNIWVVPNGYEDTVPMGRATGPAARGRPPTIALVGLLRYGPNADGARLLVREILPLIHQVIPDARVRLVGQAGPDVTGLHLPPAVTVTGWVSDVASELERADVIVAPLRYGSGTRTKIIEAFAHRIPVVSTALGAEGLDAIHGRHLLIGETAAELADACVALLRDQALRPRLVREAHRLYRDRFRWVDIAEKVKQVALTTAAVSREGFPTRS
ncbi:glycosyltransferase family 4 protein [Planotetraspora sp. A-T 1434]|uniref:glycosyltransferase n=1 Tax=Planotetraspora sp. A-T 1434 TaxID=2979219 RepID=UPI0021C0530E|nr:glycosyltransferase family 4 protein [Planotetraspora sp. A-T 1434]MCT9932292.1 glycosyltransferase family 4 protein [Planotetraspora sp. A-T 1434]